MGPRRRWRLPAAGGQGAGRGQAARVALGTRALRVPTGSRHRAARRSPGDEQRAAGAVEDRPADPRGHGAQPATRRRFRQGCRLLGAGVLGARQRLFCSQRAARHAVAHRSAPAPGTENRAFRAGTRRLRDLHAARAARKPLHQALPAGQERQSRPRPALGVRTVGRLRFQSIRPDAGEGFPMTLLLGRADVERLLPASACIEAVEEAFRDHALGKVPAPGILGMHAAKGGFHVKAGFLGKHFAAKVNANFPGNTELPTIQGAVILFDAANGRPLAIMDSISITAIRTAAATAVAAKYLARAESETLLVCGCGGQAAAQLQALLCVRKPRRIVAYDTDAGRASGFSARFGGEVADDLVEAARASDIIVTCTTATRYFVTPGMIRPGAFIAAVGADSENKQEIDPALLAQAKVVTDLTEQAARIGDLHHAIEAGVMKATDVHAELGEVIAGRKKARESADEIIVFDSTGTGLQDVAAAIAVYRRALQEETGMKGTLPTFALAGAAALSAHAENFDMVKPGSLPAGWECGVTGKGTPRWTAEADRTAP